MASRSKWAAGASLRDAPGYVNRGALDRGSCRARLLKLTRIQFAGSSIRSVEARIASAWVDAPELLGEGRGAGWRSARRGSREICRACHGKNPKPSKH